MDDSTLARLEQLGFEPSSVAQHGGTIVVDDDIVLDRNALLAGEYAASPVEAVDSIEKGYRYKSGIVSKANAGKIKLAWATGAGSLHVDGTKACTGSAAECLHNPGPKYTTIMSMLQAGNCSSISPRLTQDDYATAAALY